MIDFALGVLATLAVLRGWRRGVWRELVSLLLLVAVALAAFRLAPAVGSVLESWAGVSALAGRFLAGVALFAGLMMAAVWFVGRAFAPAEASTRGDQVGGAVAAGVWVVALASLMFYFLTALPLDDAADEALAGSRMVELLTGEESVAGRLVNAAAGDRVLEALVNLDLLVGDRQVVVEGDEAVAIPASDDLSVGEREATEVFDLLNVARVEAGVEPLAFSEALAEVASAHAREMYEDGYFSHRSPQTGTVADRVAAVSIPYSIVGENLALAPTAATVHDGLLDSPGHRANMLEPRYRRVGVGAVIGPLGLMVVEVFTG